MSLSKKNEKNTIKENDSLLQIYWMLSYFSINRELRFDINNCTCKFYILIMFINDFLNSTTQIVNTS